MLLSNNRAFPINYTECIYSLLIPPLPEENEHSFSISPIIQRQGGEKEKVESDEVNIQVNNSMVTSVTTD